MKIGECSAFRRKDGSGMAKKQMIAELDERKLKILTAVIRNYLETGEPVGSRTISKYTDLNLSSATIRNEMSDLEELGYIVQPYTSAGRIPTDKGYRLYVDSLLQNKEKEVENMKNVLIEKAGKLDKLLKEVAKLLAANTNYTSMITGPQYRSRQIKFIQLSEITETQLLAVIVLEGNIVKNRMVSISEEIGKEDLIKLNVLINTFLQGLDTSQINISLIKKLKEQSMGHEEIISSLLDEITAVIEEEDEVQIYTSGTTNIFKYPELNDTAKVTGLLNAFEEKSQLETLMNVSDDDITKPDIIDGDGNNEHGIKVYIGAENQLPEAKDCTVITADYQIKEGVYGKVGIIGPKRMDYEKVVGTLKNFMGQLDDIFKENQEDGEKKS